MIRAPLPALSLATIAALCSCSDPDHGPVDGQRAFAHTDRIVGMSPRPPGSEGIRKVADYIEQQIRESTGLELQRHTFEKPDLADGVEYQNLWVEIPGRLRAAGEARPHVPPIPRSHRIPAALAIVSGGLTVQLLDALKRWPDSS